MTIESIPSPPTAYEFRQVDVFTNQSYGGNPLAVILNADSLSSNQMRTIARDMALSETSFVTAATVPGADYRVRIFTPNSELPFAGHPSIGTAHVLYEEGILEVGSNPKVFHQELGIGVLPIEIRPAMLGARIVMTQGEPEFRDTTIDLGKAAATLNLDPSAIERSNLQPLIVSTGLPQLMIPIYNLAIVRDVEPDLKAMGELEKELGITGCFVFSLETRSPEIAAHARFFSPAFGIVEDPATGSAAGALAAYLVQQGVFHTISHPTRLVIEQGEEIGRPSRIHIEVEHDGWTPTKIKVGGYSMTVLKGEILA